MARTVNQEEFTAKRNSILDTAQRLVYSKGYERMTIQDILNELNMSSGAFYHYFDSKPAVLEAFIERIRETTEKPLLPIIQDPQLTAIEKLQGFFDTFDRMRTALQSTVIDMLRIWYTDGNAIVRQKVEDAIIEQRAPLLAKIVRQGLQEGVFTVTYPDQAGEVLMALIQCMGDTHARMLLALDQGEDVQRCIEAIVAIHWAYMDAVEGVLGTPSNTLYRADTNAVQVWVTALNHDQM